MARAVWWDMKTITLWRAAKDDSIGDCASFAESEETARHYLDNPGYGGAHLYRAEIEIDMTRVLDVSDESDATGAIADAIGHPHPGAIGADEYAPRVAEDIRDAGYDWVRVRESYPEDTITWIVVGGLDAEPDLEEVL